MLIRLNYNNLKMLGWYVRIEAFAHDNSSNIYKRFGNERLQASSKTNRIEKLIYR